MLKSVNTTVSIGVMPWLLNEPDFVQMLFNLNSSMLAFALFFISKKIGKKCTIKYNKSSFFTNFGFIVFDEKERNDKKIKNKKISVNMILKKLNSGDFINIRDSSYMHKKSFVDCILNRNPDINKFYYQIRKALPVSPLKIKNNNAINIFSITESKIVEKLLSRKLLNALGVMNRFFLLKKDFISDYMHNKECFLKMVYSINRSWDRDCTPHEFISELDDTEMRIFNDMSNKFYEEIKECIFIRDDICDIYELYKITVLKVNAIIKFLKSFHSRGKRDLRRNSSLLISDIIVRKLINEKILVLSEYSKNKKLLSELYKFVHKYKIIKKRDIQRKFQNFDKLVLNIYINELLQENILRKTFLTEDSKGKKIATMFHVNNKSSF